jgi:hypothetical protein
MGIEESGTGASSDFRSLLIALRDRVVTNGALYREDNVSLNLHPEILH